jgi:microsomal dipeptidase-like Zn-dependent dipeptidase
MRFFDAHCDTIGPLLENGADFMVRPEDRGAAAARAPVPHVTLPALKAGCVGAQVFAAWVWTFKHKGREFEVGMTKVEGVRRLCAEHPEDLFLASTGADLALPFPAVGDPVPGSAPTGSTATGDDGWPHARIAVLPSLENSDPLVGDIDNLFAFHDAGVRLLTLAWGDNAFCGSTFGDGSGLTKNGVDLVAACESLGVMVDVSHLSDRGFADICRVAERPFVASHSNCRSLCPSSRNLTDDMIRSLGERGGVMGVTLAPGFLSRDYWEKDTALNGGWYQDVVSGRATVEEIETREADAVAAIPQPPLSLLVDHVKWAINEGGEDAVGLGGDLDGVSHLPEGFIGAEDYPRIETLLREGGLTRRQVEKVCYGNFLRVFQDILG